ncbi:MAG: hypothetical protein GXP45_07325 [bacterium]|nr:hypothetical protein [bacterium]
MIKSYKYACALDLINDHSLYEAELEKPITRLETAKLLSLFAQKVFFKTEDKSKNCHFNDMQNYDSGSRIRAEKACQLGIM